MNFSLPNFFTNLRTKSVEITLILLFLIWTPLLINSTLEIQHSCFPLIKVSQTRLPEECYNSNPPITEKDETKSTTGKNKIVTDSTTNTNGNDGKIPPQKKSFIQENSELVAGTTAIVIAGGLAIATAPVTLVAGIGVASYFLIQKVIDNLPTRTKP